MCCFVIHRLNLVPNRRTNTGRVNVRCVRKNVSKVFRVCMCVSMVQQRSDLGAVGAMRGRKRVRGTVVTQRGRTRQVCTQRKRHRPVLVVGVEAQPLASVTHVVCETRATGVRRAGGTVVVERTGVQLVQRDWDNGCAVHCEGIARIARKVRERVRSHHGAHIHLRIILLTAVILQRVDEQEMRGERACERVCTLKHTVNSNTVSNTHFKKEVMEMIYYTKNKTGS